MRIVAVDAPCLRSPIHKVILSWASHVIHDFFATIFLKRFADARAESLQHLVPRSPRPLPAPARPRPPHRIKDAVGIMNLSDRRRTLRTKPSAACWMLRVTFKLRDLSRFLIDIGEKSASRFAVEAYGGNKLVMFFNAARPRSGIEFDPVVPLLHRRVRGEVATVALEISHC